MLTLHVHVNIHSPEYEHDVTPLKILKFILTESLVVLSLELWSTIPFTTRCNTFKIKRSLKIYIEFKHMLT